MSLGLYPVGGEALGGAGFAQLTPPALPSFQAVGSPVKQFKKAATINWPTHQALDIGLLFVESNAGDTPVFTTASGFAAVTGSPFAAGTTQLSVYWCRATSASMPAVVIAKPADHIYGVIASYRGCAQAGNPWEAIASGAKSTASASLTATGVTSLSDNSLIVIAVASDKDSNNPFASAEVNAALSSLTERFDDSTTLGSGGGIALVDGTKETPGATGSTTMTVVTSANAYATLALKGPGNVSVALTGAGLTVSGGTVGSFVGTATVSLIGAQATAQRGSPVIAGSAPVTVTGASATSAAGSVSVLPSVSVSVNGAQASIQPGTVEPRISVNFVPTGERATAEDGPTGSVAAGTAGLEGASVTATPGSVSVSADVQVALEGAQVVGAAGSATIAGSTDAAVALAGAELASSYGVPIGSTSTSFAVNGQSLTAAGGSVTVDTTVVSQSVTVNLTGNALLSALGDANVATPEPNGDARRVASAFAQRRTVTVVDGVKEAVRA